MNQLPQDTVYDLISSPVGDLQIWASPEGLHAVKWNKSCSSHSLKKSPRHSIICETKKQLKEYFSGKRTVFSLPLAPVGTDFQKRAWLQLAKIPYGKTISYQDQAKKLGDANKCRAVGMANSKNPISIIVPCHRVIAKDGSLHGFGGGISNKKILLDLEKQN